MTTYRWIEGEEMDRLKPVLESYGWTPLNPDFSKAIIAEDEFGKLLGFNVLQMVLRPEPMWVEAQHRRGEEDIAMVLADKMVGYLREAGAYYWEVRAESPFAERLCAAHGMQKIEVPMFAGGVK